MPEVSVIMPFHNSELYLGEAIESVLGQTFADWELLLIDDGATDASRSIAIETAKKHPRVRIVQAGELGSPLGAARARNIGIENATGTYLAFLDADDIYLPSNLADGVAALREHGVGLVYGSTQWFGTDETGREWLQDENMVLESGRVHNGTDLVANSLLLTRWTVPCTCAVMVRRDLAVTLGGFDTSFRLYEDQTFWCKAYLRQSCFVHGKLVARYRQHSGSVSAAARIAGEYRQGAAHPARVAFLDWVSDYVRSRGQMTLALWWALEVAYLPYRPRSVRTICVRLVRISLSAYGVVLRLMAPRSPSTEGTVK